MIGWSAGNETFAIALLNKPEKEVAAVWDDKLVDLTLSARKSDPTRDFITLDGDRDMEGRLPEGDNLIESTETVNTQENNLKLKLSRSSIRVLVQK